MSERFKSWVYCRTDWGTVVVLTCHFKFDRATMAQKFSDDSANGNGRPICNGCGPAGYGALVPDSILGVNITICGHIHNWAYQWGVDREDKMVADETFGDNMDRLIRDYFENECHKLQGGILVGWRTWLARRRFNTRLDIAEDVYEKAVKIFGKSAFWDKRRLALKLEDIK